MAIETSHPSEAELAPEKIVVLDLIPIVGAGVLKVHLGVPKAGTCRLGSAERARWAVAIVDVNCLVVVVAVAVGAKSALKVRTADEGSR